MCLCVCVRCHGVFCTRREVDSRFMCDLWIFGAKTCYTLSFQTLAIFIINHLTSIFNIIPISTIYHQTSTYRPDSQHSQRGFIFCVCYFDYIAKNDEWLEEIGPKTVCVFSVACTHTWNGSKKTREEMDELAYRMHDSCEHGHFPSFHGSSNATLFCHWRARSGVDTVTRNV